jgi:hypothetical protein
LSWPQRIQSSTTPKHTQFSPCHGPKEYRVQPHPSRHSSALVMAPKNTESNHTKA